MTKPSENKKKVLILGDKRKYSISLERVLSDSDFSVDFLPNSEESKDIILKEIPDLMIVDLDEIGPEEFILCEKLRSQPLSYKIPFIFLTPKDIYGDSVPKFVTATDQFILKPFNLYMTLFLANKTLSSLQKSDILSSSNEKTINGDLAQISLTDLIQIFSMNKKSGLLTITYQSKTANIYFHKGSIVFSSIGKIEGQKAIFRLIGLKNGNFEFSPGKLLNKINMSINTDELLLEGMHQIDVIENIKESFPPLESVITINRESDISKLKSSKVLVDIINLCHKKTTIREVIDNSPFCDLDVYEGLRVLFTNGIIQLSNGDEKKEDENIDPLVEKEEFLDLRKYFKRIHWAEHETLTSKLLIISADDNLEKEFIKTIEDGFKSFSAERKFYSIEGKFREIGSFRITHEAFLSLFSFSSSVELSPLWELVSLNRIGTIALIDSKNLNSFEYLKEAAEFLSTENSYPLVCAFTDPTPEKNLSIEYLRKNLLIPSSADILFYKNSDALSVKEVLRKIIEKILEYKLKE
ncbi:MAG: hypothetical protein A2W05_09870 [Candidatus Schekmanbacteria bacterium RBG_16_38_10]|uniref:Response regulatory domain-containing protein n=1 Tax=Candidatus Schekmanbacteria bacterium RBG_16_38_10 TaxID=1817879 RepID=A0A1F7RMD5_9BACT|nr:MAG: hypothetical protein A2W05_09870 [Candidatus Schekmanbacteria bacterium RBG_16_38_10]